MNLNITYVGGAASNAAPAGFYSAVSYVVNYYDTLFTNNVTVNIDVDYGKILNPNTNTFESLSSGDLGENYYTGFGSVSYAAVKNVLVSQNAPGSSTLPSSSPEPANYTLYMNSGEAKALGFLSGTVTALDGSAGFSSNVAWDFSPTTVPTANQYYLVGSIEHEFSEVMGRDSYLNGTNQYFVMDLYRYAAPHVLQTGTGGPSYFSLNSGVTNLDNWNNFQTGNNGDLGDWAPSAGPDSYLDNSNPGVVNPVTNTDIALMEALGWTSNYVAPTVTVQNVSVAESTSIAASSFITLSNAAGDNVTQYTLEDTGMNGHFTVNGVSQPDGQSFNVSSLSSVAFGAKRTLLDAGAKWIGSD